MQETEDVVTRLGPDRLAVDLFDRSYLTLEFRREVAAALITLQAELRVRATTIATLRAEVEGLRADCARAAEVLESWRRAFPDAWSLRDQQVLVKLNRAAIDAAKAGEEA